MQALENGCMASSKLRIIRCGWDNWWCFRQVDNNKLSCFEDYFVSWDILRGHVD